MQRKFYSALNIFLVFTFWGTTQVHANSNKNEKKVLRLALSEDVKTSDPAVANDVVSAELVETIYEGLLDFSYLGRLGELSPALAEAMPTFKEKNRSVHFRLRKDVYFQDDPAFPGGKGRALTSEDVIYSLKRIADPATNSPSWWMFDGVIVGFNEWRESMQKSTPKERQALFDGPIAGLLAPNAHTLIIKLINPTPLLLQVLAMGPASVVPREAVEKYGQDFGNHPVGTGAFRLKEWVRGSKVLVERNPTFRNEFYPTVGSHEDRQAGLLIPASKPIPFVQEIFWSIIKEEQPRWLKFRNRELDVSVIPKDNFTEAIDNSGRLSSELSKEGIVVHKAPSMTTWWIEFNLKDPILGANLKLRKALAHAFDRARALELLHNNRRTLSASPLPLFLEGATSFKNTNPYPYDIAAASRLLAEAGFPEGKGLPELSFDLRGPGTTPRQLGELIKSNFEKIGVKLKILANSFPEALEKQKTSRYQMMLGGWAGDYPDPENYLQLFVSTNAAPGTNATNFKNKEFDSLYAQIRYEQPSSGRTKRIGRMVNILQEEVPCIFFFHALDYRLSRSWLKNYRHHMLNYGTGKYLDVELKKTR